MNQDQQNLRLLSIFHYVMGGLSILGSVGFGLMYVYMGSMVQHMPPSAKQPPPPPGFGNIFVGVGVAAIVFGTIVGVLILMAGAKLAKHESRIFCIVIAAIQCLNMPLGTVLGVFTIITLCKPSVIQLFEGGAPQVSAPPY